MILWGYAIGNCHIHRSIITGYHPGGAVAKNMSKNKKNRASQNNEPKRNRDQENELNAVIEEILAGDTPQSYSFVATTRRYLWQFHLRSEPSEIIHEAYLRGRKFIHEGGTIKHHIAWLKRTSYNIVREKYRESQQDIPTDPQTGTLDQNASRNPRITEEQLTEQLGALWGSFKILFQEAPKDAQLILWKYHDNLTWEQVRVNFINHDGTDLTVEALRQRATRIKKRLRQIYHSLEGGTEQAVTVAPRKKS
jgi:hypothetical protein